MSKAWLRDLEEKVQEAAERLRAARADNDRLQAENRELQAKVAELEEAFLGAPASDPEAESWQEERAEIRGRVEKLVEHLSQLLETE